VLFDLVAIGAPVGSDVLDAVKKRVLVQALAIWGKMRMLGNHNGDTLPCVLIDLNTQRDFFDPAGACPVVDPHEMHRELRRVIAWAKRNQAPVVSSMDSRRRVEMARNGQTRYCVEGSNGQGKLPFTLLPNRVFVAGDNTLAISTDLFHRHQQVIFPQRTADLFANPKADRFMTQLHVDEFILFGAIAECEIKAVALGLIARHKRATVVTDACGCWNRSESELSFRQMAAKGATLLTTDELLKRKLARPGRYTATTRLVAWPVNPTPRNGVRAVPVISKFQDSGNGHSESSRRVM